MTPNRFCIISLFVFSAFTLSAQSTVTIQATPNPAILGAPVVITATVTPATATGRVTFYDGVTLLGTKPLTSGAASLSTIALPPGVRKLRAYYGGDASIPAATSTIISQTINAQPAASLATGVPLSAPQYIYNFATGDFNGDGKPDVAIASGANIIIELGDGAGNFRAGYTAAIPFAGSLITADFNGDGVSDLALTTLLGPLYVLLGNGDGTFQAAVSYPAPSGVQVAAGDFNGDGKADLVVTNNGNGVSILLGQGDGTFQAAVAYVVDPQPNPITRFVLVADMNGDGKADLVTGSSGGSRVSVLLGNGDGTFQAPIPATTPNSNALAAGDFNGDGKTDIAGAGPTGVDILFGNGDGTLKPPVNYPTATFANSIVAGDFNGDGKTDLSTGGLSTYILTGRGDGTFASPTVYSTTSVLGLISGDFNGDGRSDYLGLQGLTLQVLLGSSNSILATAGTPQSVAINTPLPVPLEITLKQGSTPLSGVTVTYTAPADAPLTATAILSSPTAVTDASGVARVNATANARAGAYTITAQALGLTAVFNLNNLSAPPSILRAYPTLRQSALLGAVFTLPLQVTLTDLYGSQAGGYTVTFTAPSAGASAALSASTVVTNAAGQATVIATANNVAGSYVVTASVAGLSATFALTNVQPVSVTLGTSANPTNLSEPVTLAATVNSTSAAGRVTFFDGAAILGISNAIAGVATLSTSLLPAGVHKLSAYYRDDANSIAGSSNVVTQTVKALPGGTFTTQNPIVLNPPPSSAAVGDFNGDGKPDLAFPRFVNNVGAVVTVVIGKGDGSFQAPVDYVVSQTGAYNLALGDFNGDGKTDIAVTTIALTTNSSATSVSVLLGNGDGTFRPSVNYPALTTPLGSVPLNAIAVGDFNGDGKADVVFGYVTSTNIFEGPTVYPIFVNLLLGNGDGTLAAPLTFTSLPYSFTQPIVRMVTGDFNGDGKVDLILSPGLSTPSVVLGNGDGTAQTPVTLGLTGSGFNSLIAGDFNGDGKLDVVVDHQILLGKGDGTFQNPSSAGSTAAIATGDFNGDGILDLVAPGTSANITSILFGKGDGTFQQGPLPTGGVPLAVADFNGDGIADLFVANATSATVLLGVATGGNPSGQPASITASGGTPQSALLGSAFAQPLVVNVNDANGQPVNGAIVTFTPPATGPGATLSAVTAATNSSGVASLSATANNIPGSYVVTASVNGLSTTFALTNLSAGGGNNLALSKTAIQSTTLPGYATAGPGSAIDGNTDGNFFNNSVTHTDLQANPWWQVDLATSSAIGSVVIWNRTDCCSDRLTDYWVFISDTPFGTTETPATLVNRAATFSYHQTSAPNPFTTVATPGAQGRYVRVQLSGTNNLSLAEVQVVPASAASTNLALNRAATQSGNYYSNTDASRAVDGNTDGNFYDGSVAHTSAVSTPWWQVDLGAPAIINSVMIWNRTDCCASRLGDYWVFVSNDPFLPTDTPATLQTRPGTYGVHQTTVPNPSALVAIGVQGRYVRIQLTTTNVPLALAEVQVLGTGGAPPATNLAVNKPASQSSTLPGYPTAVASSAVDGNTDGNFFDGSVSHTNLEANPWWQVDLGASASITSVVVWNRTDACCVLRLQNYWIFISDTPFLPTDTPATLRNRAGTISSNQMLVPFPQTAVAIAAQGRYVRIQLDGTGNLNLAEVQVFGIGGTHAVTNVAAGKAASQSSTLAGYSTTGPEKAVDGNTNGGFFNGSVTHTNPEANAWWQVDLGTTPTISSVVVWNRTDCCSDRLNDYWVFVSNTPFAATDTPATLQGRANTFASHQTAAPSPSTTINVGTTGRYVRVQLSGTNALSLAEVQVFGQ